MKSKKIPTYLKYYLSKTRLNGLVFNKTYLENLSGTSFYLDHSIEDKIKINFKASESTQESFPTPESSQDIHVIKGDNTISITNSDDTKEQNYTINLGTLEMCNINNYADEFFKNVPECVYYDNTLEVGKWYKYGRIGKVVLDGSETWKYTNNVFYINGFLRFVKGQPVLSNYFRYGGSATNTTTAYQNGNNTISFNVDDGSSIYIRNDSITNINDFNDWLSTHNTEVYYVLATPTKTLLTDTLQEELENIYNNAHTYDKITNINQINEDRPFILDISYYRKVK